MSQYSLKVKDKSSRIEAYTGVNPDELNEEISATYRALLDAKRITSLKKQLKDIKLAVLMEKQKQKVIQNGPEPSQASCKTFALAQPEYLTAVYEEDEAKGNEILLDAKYEQLKGQLKTIHEEARLARDELYRLQQKT